jgi:hypothetical protein
MVYSTCLAQVFDVFYSLSAGCLCLPAERVCFLIFCIHGRDLFVEFFTLVWVRLLSFLTKSLDLVQACGSCVMILGLGIILGKI